MVKFNIQSLQASAKPQCSDFYSSTAIVVSSSPRHLEFISSRLICREKL